MPMDLLLDLAPGLLIVAVAILLGAGLGRWFDPVPWRVLWAFVALVILLLPAVLAGGRVPLPLDLLASFPPYEELGHSAPPANRLQGDLIHQVVPHEVVSRESFAAGEWPLWNPAVGAGMPLLADAQAHTHWLQPVTLPALVLPLPEAFGLTAALRILVALVFTYLFLRRVGLGEGPSFFGSISYGCGAFIQVWLLWPIANSASVLPMLLYAVVLAAERGARRDWALTVFAAAAAVLAGHPETTLYVGLTATAVSLRWALRSGGARRKLLTRYAAAAGLAGCLAAPALLPMLEYLPQTHRYHLLEMRNRRLEGIDPFEGWRTLEGVGGSLGDLAGRLAPTFAPLAQGSDLYGEYWGQRSTYLYGVAFPGTVALLLALSAYGPVRRRFPTERGLLAVGVPLTLAVVARPPGLRHLFAATPLLDRSPADHARVALLLGFFLAVLAAMTLERWRRGEGRRRDVLAAGAVLATVVVVATLAFAPSDPDLLAGVRCWTAAGQVATLAVAGFVLASRTARRRAVLVPGLLGIFAFAELGVLFAPANRSMPEALFYPETAATRFLRGDLEAPAARGDRMAGLADALGPNIPSVYGLADPRISNASKPWEYTLLVAPLVRSVRDMTDVFDTPVHPLYRLLGVRYLVIRDEFPLEPLKRVFQGDGTLIYETPEPPLPRLFLPEAVEVRAERWRPWTDRNRDFGRLSLASSGPSAGTETWTAQRPGTSFLVLEPGDSATRLRARLGLLEPRLLASSVYQDGNWRLLVDGERVETVRTNGVFVGAWLPPGGGRLDLLYRPTSIVLGSLLAGLGLAAGVAWWLAPLTGSGGSQSGRSGGSPAATRATTASRRGLPEAVQGSSSTTRQRLGTS